MTEQEDKAERTKFNMVLDALVAVVQGHKRLEITKTYDVDNLDGIHTVIKSEKTVYRVIDNK